MRVLYPCNPFEPKCPDENWQDEYVAAKAAGISVSMFSLEDFESGLFRARPALQSGELVLYRGWMLTLESYARLEHGVTLQGARMLTDSAQYRLGHHLPGWYPRIADLSSETVCLTADTDFNVALEGLDWPGYFVKDYVKSLNTAGGSLVDTPAQVAGVVALLQKYRGRIEGGICVRCREAYIPESERRYFVANGRCFASDGVVPAILSDCASRIPSPFFAVDLAMRSDGVERVVELGDGQVSDRKEWSVAAFVELLRAMDAVVASR